MTLQAERALFEACLEIPVAERGAWLAAHCEDSGLRERVMRLLAIHEDAAARTALERPPQRLANRQIGRYRLIERIGEGAMGDVYLAEQIEPVLRRVAIKVIKPGMDSREVIARFELERQTLALMSHPSIAHIIDAGTTEAGRPYFAMEYVPGIPLTKYCDQHRLSLEQRLDLFLQICDAVQHAHQKGVIHRDLKPGNLLVSEINGRPLPKVIDFGIAKAVALEQPSQAHTRIGHLIGTPEYMSPEQAQLSPLDVDTRADVYSLGVVLHELLTGILPFKATNPNATPAMLVQELLTHDPAAPSTRVHAQEPAPEDRSAARGLTPRQLAARLAGDLDWIVLKALEKDRNRRYGSPSELAADIRRHLANEPVMAGPPSAIYRLRKFAARHRVGLSLVSLLFAAVLIFGGAMAYQAHQLAIQRDEARFQAQRAEASSEFMSLMLEEVGPGGAPLTALELVDRGVELLERQYGEDPRFMARMLMMISRRYMDLGSTEKQVQVLDRAHRIASDLADAELVAGVECIRVQTELDAGRLDDARRHMQQAHEALARLDEPALATHVDCLRAEAYLAQTERNLQSAEERLRRAQALLEEAGATRGLQYHAVLTELGNVYYRGARYRDALELNERTAEALDRNGRGGTFGRVTVTMNRATVLYRLGEVLRAEAVAAEGMRRAERLRGNEPATPPHAIAYAIILNRRGRWEDAANLLTSAREQAKSLGYGLMEVRAVYHLGRALIIGGKVDEGRALLEEAQRSWSRNAAANSDQLADLTRTLADLELAQGNLAEAGRLIESSLSQFGYPTEVAAIGLSSALTSASRIRRKFGELEEAEKYAAAALRIAESAARDPQQSADVGEALLALAAAQLARGDGNRARSSVERAVQALTHSLGPEQRLTREALDLQGAAARAPKT